MSRSVLEKWNSVTEKSFFPLAATRKEVHRPPKNVKAFQVKRQDVFQRGITQISLYTQTKMICEKLFVMQSEAKHLGCTHVGIYEILHLVQNDKL